MEEQETSILPKRVVYAGFWQRFAALIIDLIVLRILDAMIHNFVGGSNFYYELIKERHTSLSAVSNELIYAISEWAYKALLESSPFQATLGKMAMGIIVTDTHGNPISFGRATGRFFAKYISTITLLIGYFMMLWDDRKQTLHDKIAGTLVVKKQPVF